MNRFERVIAGRCALCLLLALSSLFLFCNYATHSYNAGRLLNPGETHVGMGYGKRTVIERWYSYQKPSRVLDSIVAASNGKYEDYWDIPYAERNVFDYEEQPYPSFAFQYRLGVLAEIPFGKGLEFGWLYEIPSLISQGPFAPYLEFDIRLGLQGRGVGKGLLSHNVAAGWGIGQWVDNSLYLEYAAGWRKGSVNPYANYRFALTASDVLDDPFESTNDGFGFGRWKEGDRYITNRIALGMELILPDMLLIPDRIFPEWTIVFPNYHVTQAVGAQFHVGFHWWYK